MLRDIPVNMYRVLVLVVFVAVASADVEDMKKKCHRLAHPGTMHCCKDGFKLPKINIDDIKECMEIPHAPHTCDHDICIGKKRGYASDDGTIDKEAFMKVISEDFKDMPTLLDAVKEKCVNGKLDMYGPPDACELMKMKHCVHHQVMNDCKEWDDDGPCVGIKDLVKECAKMDS